MLDSDRGTARRAQILRRHLIAYGGVIAVFFVADHSMAGPLWFHWPAMAWGAILGVHVLYCKSVDVDADWAEQRTLDVKLKSYDLGHIDSIEKAYRRDNLPDR